MRGLSTLLILKGIMQRINAKRELEGLSYARPCDVFDLIGGTSTGGCVRTSTSMRSCTDLQLQSYCNNAWSPTNGHPAMY